MGLPEPRPLEDLTELSRQGVLTVFVAGPGQGEGIALALPDKGWVLIDGCSVGRQLPLQEIYDQWACEGDYVQALILTHPHTDHVKGLATLLESKRYAPRYVGVTGDSPKQCLVAEARVQAMSRNRAATSDVTSSSAVLNALAAIATWSEHATSTLLALHDGQSIPTGIPDEDLRLWVRAPDAREFAKWWTASDLSYKKLRDYGNELSAIIEVAYGETRVVLTGDLPVKSSRKGGSAFTWPIVLGKHPQLANHIGLKLPHHGSTNAVGGGLLRKAPHERAWILTPFNSKTLPPLGDGEGLQRILECQDPVLLTAPPVRADNVPAMARVSRRDLADRVKNLKLSSKSVLSIPGGQPVIRITATAPLDAVWCCQFDRRGRILGRWRGKAAMEVTEGDSTPVPR